MESPPSDTWTESGQTPILWQSSSEAAPLTAELRAGLACRA